MIKSFKELADAAKAMEKKTVLAVVEAHDEHTLEAVMTAKKDGIIDAMLIGNEEKIREIITQEGADPADYRVRAVRRRRHHPGRRRTRASPDQVL